MFKRALVVLGLVLASQLALAQYKQPKDVSKILQSIETNTGGRLGVYALNLEKRLTIGYKASEAFPMASTYKFPISLYFLHLVDIGRINLDAPVQVTKADRRVGHSPLSDKITLEGERTFTAGELLQMTLGESDNAASDIILRMVGGPAAINTFLKHNAVMGIRVDRSEAQLAITSNGIKELPDSVQVTLEETKDLISKVPDKERRKAMDRFLKDPRDTATPQAMVNLLELALTNQLLSYKSTNLLLNIMKQTPTGVNRIKALLPSGSVVAHKTGTAAEYGGISGATNDVGIIYLPQNKGHILLAVYISGSNKTLQEREAAIAQVARIIYDHWAQPE